jgi:DivIVA domain-containing protein
MEITPKVINEIEFPLKVRGYDPDEVDDFLERMAVGVGQLQERLEQLAERAATAERKAAELEQRSGRGGERPTPAEETEQLTRTLAMAQRFVDQATREAEEEATRVVSEAKAEATRLRTEADVELRRIRTESHTQIAEEVRELERNRDALRGDVEALVAHADAQRDRLRASLGEFERLLDNPEKMRAAGAPDSSGAGLPDFARDLVARDLVRDPTKESEPAQSPPPMETDDEVDAEPEPVPVEASNVRRLAREPATATATAGDVDDDDDAWSRFAQGPVPVDAGPPTAVHLEEPGDPYLSELRRVMSDDAPGGTAGSAAPFDHEHEAGYRPGFGKR